MDELVLAVARAFESRYSVSVKPVDGGEVIPGISARWPPVLGIAGRRSVSTKTVFGASLTGCRIL
jgi:hypothetical protein